MKLYAKSAIKSCVISRGVSCNLRGKNNDVVFAKVCIFSFRSSSSSLSRFPSFSLSLFLLLFLLSLLSLSHLSALIILWRKMWSNYWSTLQVYSPQFTSTPYLELSGTWKNSRLRIMTNHRAKILRSLQPRISWCLFRILEICRLWGGIIVCRDLWIFRMFVSKT